MEEMYKGMNPTYYVGLQSVFKFNPADKIENQNEFLDGKHLQAPKTISHGLHCLTAILYCEPCAMASGSPGSRGSGSSSNTATQMTTMDQGEGAALNMMAEAARQAVLPLLDRPLPVRRRQRKPNRKTVKTDIPAVTSTIRNRGRRPRATGRAASPLLRLCMTLLLVSWRPASFNTVLTTAMSLGLCLCVTVLRYLITPPHPLPCGP